MRDDKAEIAARYHVVELLYRGDLVGAEQSLNSFCQDQSISPEIASFYRFLLEQARSQHPGSHAGSLDFQSVEKAEHTGSRKL